MTATDKPAIPGILASLLWLKGPVHNLVYLFPIFPQFFLHPLILVMDLKSLLYLFIFHDNAKRFQIFLLEIERFFKVILGYVLVVQLLSLEMVDVLEGLHLLV